ncbi:MULTISPECIES: cytochrome c-550 PedF [Hydrocarboniphaga]|nr:MULTISPECIES: cytochrome c-550 PedF [Hydrocarboniphaga]MDZ4079456.1 cytochrome c-550 PedF [Hydrocarboniphaga sp.]
MGDQDLHRDTQALKRHSQRSIRSRRPHIRCPLFFTPLVHHPVFFAMSKLIRRSNIRQLQASVALALVSSLFVAAAHAHGDVAPQPVDTKDLPKLKGEQAVNPYRGTPNAKKAAEIGSSAFNQNCARCHGLGAVSGGIAPDLRYLPEGKEGDEFFAMRIRNGSVRNGVTYMPPFGNLFSEEAIWAIRSYLDSVQVAE